MSLMLADGADWQTILDLALPEDLIDKISKENWLDFSYGYVNYAREHIADARLHFAAGNAMILPYRTGCFDVVVSGLVLNFVPQPETALSEADALLLGCCSNAQSSGARAE